MKYLSVLAAIVFGLLGQRIGEQLAISESQACSGELTKIERIGGTVLRGAALSGWAWDRRWSHRAR